METTFMTAYSDLPNLSVPGDDGVVYAYRDTEGTGTPLLLLQHFRGNLDSWDPALVDALGNGRRVLAFDNVGVGGSSGVTPSTIAEMAHGALNFVDALGLDQIDILGFSIGSFVAQEIMLTRPKLASRAVLASAAPQGAEDMHGWASDVISAVGKPETKPDGYLDVFFTHSEASHSAGVAALGRMLTRKDDRDAPTSWDTRLAQYDAVCTWGIPNHSLLQRISAINTPVLIANGDSDPMIVPRYSYLLAGLIPNSRLKIYPDAAHGFLFQHHEEFATDVGAFLNDTE
jgi:pimeloyl-ACP methyl ester carboxylesterase